MTILFVNVNPNADSREKGLALSVVCSHIGKRSWQRKRQLASRAERFAPAVRRAGQAQNPSGTTPTTTSGVTDRTTGAPSTVSERPLMREANMEQDIKDTVPGSTDQSEVKAPTDWLDCHQYDPFSTSFSTSFSTLPSKVTQDFITACNIHCEWMD